MKGILFLFFVFFSVYRIHSQSGFRSGHIITPVNDTIRGFIEYRLGVRNFEVCSFKTSKDRPITIYKPGEINGYRFEGDKYFVSKSLDKSTENAGQVFMEVLIKGPVTLFKYKDIFFIEKKDSGFYELSEETIVTVVNGQKVERESNNFVGMLKFLLSDCEKSKELIRSIELEETALMNLVESYNQCSGARGIVYKTVNPRRNLHVSMLGGFGSSRLDFSSSSVFASVNSSRSTGAYGSSRGALFGISVELTVSKHSEKVSLRGDVLYFAAHYLKNNIYSGVIETAEIGLKQLKIPVGLKYTFGVNRIVPYLILGLTYTSLFDTSSKMTRYNQATQITEVFENDYFISKGQLGFYGVAGTRLALSKRLSVFAELRGEKSSWIVFDENENRLSFTNWGLMAGIRF